MSLDTLLESQAVADLRREFDNSFASNPETPGGRRAVFLNISVAGEALAVATLDITGLAKRKRVVALPTKVTGLLEIMALRGNLIPVYDLAALLGLPASGGAKGWVLFALRETPVALAFDEFEGQVEIDRDCTYESESPGLTPICA